MDINRRYADAKVEYEAYSLRRVLGILEDEGAKERVEENTHIFFLERTVKDLRNRLTAMKDYAHKVHEKWHEALMEWKREELKADLEKRLGLKILRVEVGMVDFLKDSCMIRIFYDEPLDRGEEATEIVIAAKNPDPEEVKYEISDFLYHVMVLMAERGVTWDDITQELANR